MMLEYVGLGFTAFFLLIGLIGAFIPMLPGSLLIWLTILVYAIATKFAVVGVGAFAVITLISLFVGTSSVWLPLVGAGAAGARKSGLVWGAIGGIVGFLFFNLLGALIGYASTVLYVEYRERGDFRQAVRAGVGGLVGWGLSTALEAGGALAIIVFFIRRVALYG